VDGLVASKSAAYHSLQYRSAVCFGTARAVTDAAEKESVFHAMIGRYFRGRAPGRDYAPPTREQLDDTAMVEFRIESVTAKASRGGPRGPHDADPAAPGNAGVHPA
jgi:nitroimidazol reductase NimA-like FMN-containing flavoprotein (pyridoxamine 5'-phosphate oxidase superfamily)